ncbi:unnamed protein product [Lymnaea stagnalis]|uniref:Copper transport protein n=1 Tax=Lymnaea stagnalis TaxID=6523 RepID=A0AAV2HUW4_LYMST
MHKSTFHTETGAALLFPHWILYGKKEIYIACLLLVVMGITYQGIKFARQQYGRKCRNLTCKRYILNKGHFLQTLMYILQFLGGYILMLAVMTYNIWILLAVLVGLGLGYFFFGWGEYEEASAALHVQRIPRSYLLTCGTITPSSSATQELLPMSKSEDDMQFDDSKSSNVRCKCNNSSV